VATASRGRDIPTRNTGACGRVMLPRLPPCVHCQDSDAQVLVPLMASTARSRRIDVRVSDAQDAMIREAAALAGETVTGFLLSAAQERARELLDERRHVVMSDRAFARLAAVLDSPGEPVPAMTELLGLPRIAER